MVLWSLIGTVLERWLLKSHYDRRIWGMSFQSPRVRIGWQFPAINGFNCQTCKGSMHCWSYLKVRAGNEAQLQNRLIIWLGFCNLAELLLQLIFDFKLLHAFWVVFPFSSSLSCLNAFNSRWEKFMLHKHAWLVGYQKNPPKNLEEEHSQHLCKLLCTLSPEHLDLINQTASLRCTWGFCLNIIHVVKATQRKIVVQWRHQLLPHWLVSCCLWEYKGNPQRL